MARADFFSIPIRNRNRNGVMLVALFLFPV